MTPISWLCVMVSALWNLDSKKPRGKNILMKTSRRQGLIESFKKSKKRLTWHQIKPALTRSVPFIPYSQCLIVLVEQSTAGYRNNFDGYL